MRAQTAIAALAMVLAVAAIPVAGMAATDTVLADQHTNQTDGDANASVAPGERLSGVVGIQEAELEGEVDERTFGIRVAQAATNEARAEVVAEQLSEIRERLNETKQRKQELKEARKNGSISEGKYRAEMAQLAARSQNVKELTNRSANATQGLPADLLESKGINVTAIQTLKDRAAQLTGPEVAEIARSIAGKTAPGAGPPGDRGPGDGGAAGGDSGPSDGGGPDSAPSDGNQSATPDGTPTPAPGGSDGSDGSEGGTDTAGDGNSGSDNAGDGGDGGSGGGSSNGGGGSGGSDNAGGDGGY